MAVKLTSGPNELQVQRLGNGNVVGSTIANVVADETVQTLFDLSGRETFAVLNAGSATWRDVQSNYVLQDGDEVRISTPSGEKGVFVL
jgi:hypothetical protein